MARRKGPPVGEKFVFEEAIYRYRGWWVHIRKNGTNHYDWVASALYSKAQRSGHAAGGVRSAQLTAGNVIDHVVEGTE